MSTVDLELARWLKEGGTFTSSDAAGVEAAFGSIARTSEVMSCLALAAGADAEAARQAAFLSGPLAIDTHVVKGLRIDLLGQPVQISGDLLGYDAAPTVFVIGAQEHDDTDQTTLTVLRKLT